MTRRFIILDFYGQSWYLFVLPKEGRRMKDYMIALVDMIPRFSIADEDEQRAGVHLSSERREENA